MGEKGNDEQPSNAKNQKGVPAIPTDNRLRDRPSLPPQNAAANERGRERGKECSSPHRVMEVDLGSADYRNKRDDAESQQQGKQPISKMCARYLSGSLHLCLPPRTEPPPNRDANHAFPPPARDVVHRSWLHRFVGPLLPRNSSKTHNGYPKPDVNYQALQPRTQKHPTSREIITLAPLVGGDDSKVNQKSRNGGGKANPKGSNVQSARRASREDAQYG